MVAHYIYTQTILDLCLDMDISPGSHTLMRWGNQESLVFSERTMEVEEGGEGGGEIYEVGDGDCSWADYGPSPFSKFRPFRAD